MFNSQSTNSIITESIFCQDVSYSFKYPLLQYNASHLLPLNDEQIVSEASSHLIKHTQDFEGATVIQHLVRRSPRSVIHFLPGKLNFHLTVVSA